MQPVGQGHISPEVLWVAVPPAILVSALLWINEIPDVKADGATGRRHAVLLLGTKKAAIGYCALLTLNYIFVIIPAALGILPVWVLLGLLSAPIAFKAAAGALKNHDNIGRIIPALGQNVFTVLATPVLMAIGLVIAKLVG
jgi:1,4-dihydroxy-2-naphthoate octaprenyltransferase